MSLRLFGELSEHERLAFYPSQVGGLAHVGACNQSSYRQSACQLPISITGKNPECCVQRTCEDARMVLAAVSRLRTAENAERFWPRRKSSVRKAICRRTTELVAANNRNSFDRKLLRHRKNLCPVGIIGRHRCCCLSSWLWMVPLWFNRAMRQIGGVNGQFGLPSNCKGRILSCGSE